MPGGPPSTAGPPDLPAALLHRNAPGGILSGMSARTASERRLAIVHLVRHAHAGDAGAWEGDDDLRPLTLKGRRQAERLGRFLTRAGVQPDRLITSPKIRALQTAELVGAALGLDLRVDGRLAEGCSLGCLDALIADADASAPMLFGHDPDFSMLLSELIGAGGLEMKKGALATIDVRRPLLPGTGTLRWLIPPDALAGLQDDVVPTVADPA